MVCPISSIDLQTLSGSMIPIEGRDSREVTQFAGKRVAPNGVKVYNPAFDITPAHYITAIVTERQIFRPPYKETLGELKK